MIDYIIVQAGGKGTRLGRLTANKPKALVPVDNLPILFHLFRKFPDRRYIIIADYRGDVLREYMAAFADVQFQIVDAEGAGTCSGLKRAVGLLPENAPFMLVWSDLILPAVFELPETGGNRIGISQTLPCRWSYRDGMFEEQSSEEFGVAGLFIFGDKSFLSDVPKSGEFVRWLKDRNMRFEPVGLAGMREFGLLPEYEKLAVVKTRPFNKLTVGDSTVTKQAVDGQGRKLAERERNWYEFAVEHRVSPIPKIFSLEPLRLERIDGKNIYEYEGLTHGEKVEVLGKLTDSLKNLHGIAGTPADSFSVREAYYRKTMDRLRKIRDLVPLADNRTVTVNGRECRNVFYCKRELEKRLESLKCGSFAFIHGDCTFSNIMLKGNGEPVLIDPRGYFGHTELFGDPNYDWAKLYYSIVGNYDRFNLKDFSLAINGTGVELKIRSNNWEDCEDEFFALTGADRHTIKLLHAVIWLSLTTYAWHDYDSICGAFYNGLYYLEEIL